MKLEAIIDALEAMDALIMGLPSIRDEDDLQDRINEMREINKLLVKLVLQEPLCGLDASILEMFGLEADKFEDE